MFGSVRQPLLAAGTFAVTAFRYRSGVAALSIANNRGEVIVLPFRGQQIWSAVMDGRALAMGSQFPEPTASLDYLASYGAFFLHCGIRAMGDPGPQDDHPLHGELPSAPFDDVYLEISQDSEAVTVGGRYLHRIAFESGYRFESRMTLAAKAARVTMEVSLANLRRTPMEMMYLGHINFRNSGGPIVGTAGGNRLLRQHQEEGFSETLEAIEYRSDATAHSLQLHPGGSADYVWHRPADTPYAVRWTCRTPHEDALGLVLPATSLVDGRMEERRQGRIMKLAGGGSWSTRFGFGLLAKEEVEELRKRITLT